MLMQRYSITWCPNAVVAALVDVLVVGALLRHVLESLPVRIARATVASYGASGAPEAARATLPHRAWAWKGHPKPKLWKE